MCFSAQASFAVGGALIPAGLFCLHSAWRKSPSHLPVATIPLAFGVQQICEGFVWLSITRHHPVPSTAAALGFLFFALFFWPFWIPLCMWCLEPRPWRKRLLGLMTVLGAGWFLFLYFPVFSSPETSLRVQVVQHSIHYEFQEVPLLQVMPRAVLRILYIGFVAVPLAISSPRKNGSYFSILLLASALIAHLLFAYAFVSVWCFFAAVLTTYLCYSFYVLPELRESRSPAPAATGLPAPL